MKAGVILVTMAAASLLLMTAGERRAPADVIAAYAGGYGGLSSASTADGSTSGSGFDPGLGFQVGARVLIFDAYFDQTAFGGGKSVSRGILGLRAGLGLGGLRLVLRGGAGVMIDQGGALQAAPDTGAADRRGVVARAGVTLEKRLNPRVFWVGLGLDGEVYSLDSPAGSAINRRTEGGDLFASLQIKFELGL